MAQNMRKKIWFSVLYFIWSHFYSNCSFKCWLKFSINQHVIVETIHLWTRRETPKTPYDRIYWWLVLFLFQDSNKVMPLPCFTTGSVFSDTTLMSKTYLNRLILFCCLFIFKPPIFKSTGVTLRMFPLQSQRLLQFWLTGRQFHLMSLSWWKIDNMFKMLCPEVWRMVSADWMYCYYSNNNAMLQSF